MNWFDVLPTRVARQQVGWERRRMSSRMHELGFTYAEIGQRMGVGKVRAQQLGAYRRNLPSPAMKWMKMGFEFHPPLRYGADTARGASDALEGFTVES